GLLEVQGRGREVLRLVGLLSGAEEPFGGDAILGCRDRGGQRDHEDDDDPRDHGAPRQSGAPTSRDVHWTKILRIGTGPERSIVTMSSIPSPVTSPNCTASAEPASNSGFAVTTVPATVIANSVESPRAVWHSAISCEPVALA